MEDLERVQARLANIESVRPILSALRTVSLGRWQAAQHQQRATRQYRRQLRTILFWLAAQAEPAPMIGPGPLVVVAVGSNRGLCGRFNSQIADRTEQYLAEQKRVGRPVELAVLGQRLARLLENRGLPPAWRAPLPRRAADLTGLAAALLAGWQRRQVTVELIYQRAQGVGAYRPVVQPGLPLSLPTTTAEAVEPAGWPPIIETNGPALSRQVTHQWLVLSLVERLLESQVAEHAARFQVMEAASQNAERLVAELRLTVQSARRQAITRETQALAVGAGLLEHSPT